MPCGPREEFKNLILDVVNGVLFFLILLLPFAYLGERLCWESADLRRQAAGFALIFFPGSWLCATCTRHLS